MSALMQTDAPALALALRSLRATYRSEASKPDCTDKTPRIGEERNFQ